MGTEKVALITGAGKGIGSAIAKRLSKEGFFVIVNYNGSAAAAKETCEAIRKEGGRAEALQCNVAEYGAVEAMMEDILLRHGRIDALVNNAGITKDGLLLRMGEEDFDKVIDTNLKGSFHCLKFAAKEMVKQRYGRIVNISSVSGIMGNAGQVNYAASKAGVIGMTKAAARELSGRGITVNALAPGFIETDMTAALSEKLRETVSGGIPMKRFGTPEDIAAAAAFLCREEAAYITGQVLAVDGGMSM